MYKKFSSGFTLIELLVVIAIIGILASTVLVSFPGATKKARDSRVISAIAQARVVMIYVSANEGNYTNFSKSYPAEEMTAINDEVRANNFDGSDLIIVKCLTCSVSGGPAACMYTKLQSGDYYCADSTGKSGRRATTPNADGICPDNGASAKCGTVVG